MKTDHDAVADSSTETSQAETPETAKVETPKVETTKAETPKVETPETAKVETPKADTPEADVPKAETSKAEEVAEPTADEIAAVEPAAVEPVAAKPAEAKPAEAEPVDAKPVAAKPAEAEPVDAEPAVAATDEPDAAEPTADEASVETPAAPAVKDDEPDDAEPEDVKAEDAEPEDAEPAAHTSAEDDSTDAEPATESAGVPPAETGGKSGPGGFLAELVPPRTNKARALVAVILVALVGLGWGGFWFFNRLPADVAFQVNGVNVTEQQLEEQVQTLSALYGVTPPGADDEPRLDAFRRDVAKSTAVAMAVDEAAKKRNIVVADRQTADFLAKYIAAQYGEGQAGRDAFVKDLADKNTSEPKVLAEIKRQLTLKQLFGQVTADVQVTDADVKQTFDQRKDEFATPERREIHNIVVKTRPEADALIAELKGGANFEALAPQRSLDTFTKDSGGNLGLVSARDLQKEYADAAFSAPVGGLIGPVETQQKSGPMFNVGKVVQSQPSVPADFDKIKDGVRRLVFTERSDAKWRSFMEDQIKDSDIKYSDKYKPADPNGLPPLDGGPAAAGPGAPAAPAAPAPPK